MKDIKDIVPDFRKALKRKLGKTSMKKVSKKMKKIVVERVQDGYGVDENGKKSKFKALTNFTIEKRKETKARGKLSKNTTPDKSNQTETGRMVEDIEIKATKTKASIQIPRDRQEIYLKQVEGGREWMNLTDEELDEIELALDDALSKFFE